MRELYKSRERQVNMSKQSRVDVANELVVTISSVGRKFFNYKGNIGRLEIGEKGHIFWIDHYKSQRIYTHYKGRWRGFTGGGTLKCLIEQLREFVRTGKKLYPDTFGPWPQWLCSGDLWGYKDDMQIVRDKANELNIMEPESAP